MKLWKILPVLFLALVLLPGKAQPDISGTVVKTNDAGATITAGQVVYLAANNKWLLAQCDGTALEAGTDTTVGIALHASLSGQPLAVQTDGTITIGGTTAAGEVYVISATAGAICKHSELVSTNRVHILGIGLSATTIGLGKTGAIGVAIP